jgi:glycosyltransferase involved in cell wall biosynthesis
MEARRVLIYRNELLPPSETFILSQANALRRFRPWFGGLTRVGNGLDLSFHQVVTLCGRESQKEKARRRAFLRTACNRKLVRAIAEWSPHVIHAHFAVDACAVLPIARLLNIPLVVTLHGYDVTSCEDTLRQWPTTRAYLRRKEELWKYATAFLCVSEHVRRCAVFSGFPSEKLRVQRIGVPLHDADEKVHLRDKRVVLFVGRLVEKKGCVHLIRAMSHVQRASPGTKLVVIGDGPLRKTLEQEAAQHCRNVSFLGFQSQAEVKRWMQHACVLAVPSMRASNGDTEGLSTVTCEAQAVGLPVAAFATEGVTEAFPEERRPSLSKEGDIASLSEQILHLMKDDAAWHEASLTGRRYMETHFDLAAQTRSLEDKYEEIIARPHG